MDKNCGFFTNGQIFSESPFFTQTLLLYSLKIINFFSRTGKKNADGDRLRYPSLFEIVLDPERAQIETLEPTLFDIVLRPEEFIRESGEDLLDSVEEIPSIAVAPAADQEQQPLDPNDYDQFRYIVYEFSSVLDRPTLACLIIV